MTDLVRLADLSLDTLKVIKDGAVNVTIRVPLRDLEWADAQLGKIMEEESTPRREAWTEDGRSDEELSLLKGAFWTIARALPMSTSNFIDWLRSAYGEDALDGYVAWRASHMDDDRLKELLFYVLKDRDLNTFGLEALDAPVQRRRKAG